MPSDGRDPAGGPAGNPAVPPRVALVGATGAVGATFLQLFEERSFAYGDITLLASSRSAGRTVSVRGREHTVRDLGSFDFADTDLVFFSAGTEVSERFAPRAAARGALVIDNTNAFRMDRHAHLVVPQVNGELLRQRPPSGIVANPNCSTIPLVRLLRPLHDRYTLRSVVVSTYQAASGHGLKGVEELYQGSRQLMRDGTSVSPLATVFGQPLAFNVLPLVGGALDEHGSSLEERKMRQESRRILRLPDLDIAVTCARVPVANGHSESVVVECERPVDAEQLMEMLAAEAEVRVWRDGYPTPRTCGEPDLVHVGRIRGDPENPRRALFWLVADNLRVGAALNAVQIAELSQRSREEAPYA